MINYRQKISNAVSTFRALLLVIILLTPLVAPSSAGAAANAGNWRAGDIIDDGIFYNPNDMNVGQVQDFLNNKVPTCDTWGTSTSEYGGGTRAQYGAAHGHPAPYVCLKDYYENPTTHANNLDGNPVPSGAMSSAQIIVNAAQTYNISVRVLLTILQKESAGPLITDTWPYSSQYTNAMGYGCPDTAPCDPAYAGFYNQVTNAARQLQNYRINSGNYRYQATQTNNVLYNPNSACGTSGVYIQNKATAGLYDYTPYQPNQAALGNLYGSGDSCSSYGNRNFWRIYSDWFGSPILGCTNNEPTMPQVVSLYNPRTFDHFYTSYNCESNVVSMQLGYSVEGPEYNTTDPTAVPNAVPIFRLYNPSTQQHLWTYSQDEVNSASAYAGYRLEGVAFYMAPPDAPGVRPVYRLYNPRTFQHVWTPNQSSINLMTSQLGFRLEGVAFYTQ